MNLFNRNRVANTPAAPDTTLGANDVLPADGSVAGQLRAGSNAVLNRATSIYKNNPKAVGGLALLASALLLNRMRSR